MLFKKTQVVGAAFAVAILMFGLTCSSRGQESGFRVEGVPKELPEVSPDATIEDIEQHIEKLDELNKAFRSAMSAYSMDVYSAKGKAYLRYVEIAEKQNQTGLKLYPQAKGASVQYLVGTAKNVEEAARIIEAYTDSLADRDIDAAEAKIAVLTVHHFPKGNAEFKRSAVTKLATAMSKSKDDSAQKAATYIRGMLLRESLVGTKFGLIGATIDKHEFDISTLRGKVVLVDYWATWCAPCLREQENIRAVLDQYRKAGFAVVGVNGDNDRQGVLAYLAKENCPVDWPTLYSGGGVEDPAFKKLGIMEIPFSVLIDREGVVVDTQVDGDRLRLAVERALQPAER